MKIKLLLACSLSAALIGSQVPPELSAVTAAPTPQTAYRQMRDGMDCERVRTPPLEREGSWLHDGNRGLLSPDSRASMRSDAEMSRVCGGASTRCCGVVCCASALIVAIIILVVRASKGE